MDKFTRKFLRILKEDDAELERAAMEASLDDGTDPTDFDIDMDGVGEPDEVTDAINRRNQQEVQELESWINQTEQFLQFLNSDDPSSIQSKLAGAIPDTIMDKVKSSQQSKIARIASDIASFNQALLGFKAQSNSPSLRGV